MKPATKLKYNLYSDIENWWEACNKKSYGYDFSQHCPKRILKKIKGKKLGEVKDFLKKEVLKKKKGFIFIQKELIPYWKKRELRVIVRLEEIHKRKFPVKYINFYYTSFKRCSYGHLKNKFWMHIHEYNKDKDLLCGVITHELMHLFFEKYYWNYCRKKGLNKEQTADIKEAFSVLINSDFRDLFKFNDRGYKNHKKLRNYIAKEWKKSKNFEKVLDSAIKFVKNSKI